MLTDANMAQLRHVGGKGFRFGLEARESGLLAATRSLVSQARQSYHLGLERHLKAESRHSSLDSQSSHLCS